MTHGRRRWHLPLIGLVVLGLFSYVLLSDALVGTKKGTEPSRGVGCPTAPQVTPGTSRWRPDTFGSRAGFAPGSSIFRTDDAELRRELDAMADAGARWIRLDVDWSHIGRVGGRLDFCATDRVIGAARQAGLEVLALPAYTPAWARPSGTDDKHPPSDPASYADFVAAAVIRYRPLGVRVWELWNEPNTGSFWRPEPDPEAYARLLAAGSAAAKRAADDVLVLSGGLAPAADEPSGETLSPETFLAGVYAAVGKGPADGIAIHPYSYPALPLDPSTESWNPFLRLPRIHALMAQNGDADKQVWITEYGAPTGTSPRAVSLEDQAVAATEAVAGASRWPWTGPLLWYSYRDSGADLSDPAHNFGLVRQDFESKPARAAFSRALRGPARLPP